MKLFTNYVTAKPSYTTLLLLFFIATVALMNSTIANAASLDSDRTSIEAGINSFVCLQGNAVYSWGSITAVESVGMLDVANEVAQSFANIVNNGIYIYNGYIKTTLDNALKQSNANFYAGETSVYDSLSQNYEDALNEWETDSETCNDILEKIEYGAHIGIGKVSTGNAGEYWYSLLIFTEASIVKGIPSYQGTITLDPGESSDEFPVLLLTDTPKKVNRKAMKSYQNKGSSTFRVNQ